MNKVISTTTEKTLEAISKLQDGEKKKGKSEGEVNLLSIVEKIARNRKRGQ